MGAANVRSVQALQDLKAGLARFGSEAQQALQAADLELRHALEYLAQRQRHWENEVRRWQEELRRAAAALAACQAQASRDAEGRVYIPDCSRQEAAVQQAQVALQHAQRELGVAIEWLRRVQEATTEYQRQSQRMGTRLGSDLPKGTATLSGALNKLDSYLHQGGAVGTVAGFAGVVIGGAIGAAAGALAGGHGSGGAGTQIRDVALSEIDMSDNYIQSASDFKKVSRDDMVEGLRKLEDTVRPGVAGGATGDDFARMDAARGLDYEHGYQRIYDAFYGDDAIAVARVGGAYRVTNGFHRLTVARDLGITSLPMRVVGGP